MTSEGTITRRGGGWTGQRGRGREPVMGRGMDGAREPRDGADDRADDSRGGGPEVGPGGVGPPIAGADDGSSHGPDDGSEDGSVGVAAPGKLKGVRDGPFLLGKE